MPKTIEAHIDRIIKEIDNNLNWRFDDKLMGQLSEFAQNRGDNIAIRLAELFPHQWHAKNIKQAPSALKSELLSHAQLEKNQRVYTLPNSNGEPAIAAYWWPWGHGGTISLRLVSLTCHYQSGDILPETTGLLAKLTKLFRK